MSYLKPSIPRTPVPTSIVLNAMATALLQTRRASFKKYSAAELKTSPQCKRLPVEPQPNSWATSRATTNTVVKRRVWSKANAENHSGQIFSGYSAGGCAGLEAP